MPPKCQYCPYWEVCEYPWVCPDREQLATKLQQTCHATDTISRKAAIDATWFEPSYTDPLNVLTEVRDRLKALPSAQPKRKGKWKLCGNDDDMSMTYLCSECSQQIPEDWFYSGYKNRRWVKNGMWNFCPKCGADMRGGE